MADALVGVLHVAGDVGGVYGNRIAGNAEVHDTDPVTRCIQATRQPVRDAIRMLACNGSVRCRVSCRVAVV